MAKVKGGDKLAAQLRKLAGLALRPATLRVGFLENATYPNGLPVALVAAWQNFGTGSIPARPFFSNAIAKNRAGWPKIMADLMKANNFDAVKVMRLMGEGIKGQIQQSIIDTNAPPLSPATIARKGFDKPLVHTGHMLNSVDYEVKT